jgi:hypothetical protein
MPDSPRKTGRAVGTLVGAKTRAAMPTWRCRLFALSQALSRRETAEAAAVLALSLDLTSRQRTIDALGACEWLTDR